MRPNIEPAVSTVCSHIYLYKNIFIEKYIYISFGCFVWVLIPGVDD